MASRVMGIRVAAGMHRLFFPAILLVACSAPLCLAEKPDTVAPAGVQAASKPIPVILDTDIGNDIDDTWALALLLKCPELDVRLVVGDYGNPEYRVSLIAKLLETAGRTDIPVGVGIEAVDPLITQREWLEGYDLSRYPGKVHRDGVGAIIDIIMNSPEPVTVIAIGPLPNLAEALRREPAIAERARFIGMHGSVRLGYWGRGPVAAEYNVVQDALACQKVLSAPWDVTITPLDSCGLVQLRGEKYQKLLKSRDPLVQAIMENYPIWLNGLAKAGRNVNTEQYKTESSTLFDLVAIYLAFSEELLTMEDLSIRVTDDGFTRIDPAAKMMHVATGWKNMEAFEDFLVQRLLGPTVKASK